MKTNLHFDMLLLPHLYIWGDSVKKPFSKTLFVVPYDDAAALFDDEYFCQPSKLLLQNRERNHLFDAPQLMVLFHFLQKHLFFNRFQNIPFLSHKIVLLVVRDQDLRVLGLSLQKQFLLGFRVVEFIESP